MSRDEVLRCSVFTIAWAVQLLGISAQQQQQARTTTRAPTPQTISQHLTYNRHLIVAILQNKIALFEVLECTLGCQSNLLSVACRSRI